MVFSPCVHCQYLRWDDYRHYISNPCVYSLSWNNISDIFHQTINNTYIPLTTLSFALEYHLFGLSPQISHLINILLHLAVVLALFDLAMKLKLTPWQSFIASAVFAVHPMHVESVAWVTERKDVLGILFYMLCLRQYWSYLQDRSGKHYGLSLLFGVLSVLTKSMAVSIPWVLLLLDWYCQRRASKMVVLDKLPFAVLILPLVFITIFKLSPHPNIAHNSILIGLWTLSWYLLKFILPLGLLPAYSPAVPVVFSNPVYLRSLFILVVFIFSLFWWRKNRLFVFACLFWAGTIFFFWRFDFSDQNIVADRFMYLPSLGFCLLLGRYLSKFKAIAVLLIVVLGFLTYDQCGIWQDDLTLWTSVLVHDPKNVIAKGGQNAFIYPSKAHDVDYRKLTEAIDKGPRNAQNYLERGEALLKEGDYFLAFSDFNRAVSLDPSNYRAYSMRGQLYAAQGENKKALRDYNKALSLKQDDPLTLMQIGVLLNAMNETDQALAWFNRAINISPSMGGAYVQRGLIYYGLGKYGKSIDDFTLSISLKNDLKESYYRRARSEEALKESRMAEEDFKRSLRESPYDIKMLNEWGVFYWQIDDDKKALEILDRVISLYPYNEGAYINRGIVEIRQKQYALALKDYTSAIGLSLYPYHALITRGDIYVVTGDIRKAQEDYRSACLFSQGDTLAQTKFNYFKHILGQL